MEKTTILWNFSKIIGFCLCSPYLILTINTKSTWPRIHSLFDIHIIKIVILAIKNYRPCIMNIIMQLEEALCFDL